MSNRKNKLKSCIKEIPRFILPNNNLDGYKIDNIDEAFYKYLYDSKNLNLYEPRRGADLTIKSNEPMPGRDIIVAEIIGLSKDSKDKVVINVIDTLYYSKLIIPVIKVNGLCKKDDENKTIHITKIQRLTLADAQMVL